MRLHIGYGPVALPGWINVDILPYEGVHVLCDVRNGLPFTNVKFIFAEHFIEHLALADGLRFLKECRRVLAEMTTEEELFGCLEINRAFHGWGHRFLYNRHVLGRALRSAGFAEVTERAYGESDIAELRNLERHERHRELVNAPSVLVIEARGSGAMDEEFERALQPYLRDAVTH